MGSGFEANAFGLPNSIAVSARRGLHIHGNFTGSHHNVQSVPFSGNGRFRFRTDV
jgi:hypothetical protein